MEHFSNSYIKGFVETCYKAGLHEKQAAALLQAVSEEKAANMEKMAGKGAKQVAEGLKGLGQIYKIPFGTIRGTADIGWNKIIKPTGKGIGKGIHKLWKGNPWRGFTTTVLPGAGLAAWGYNEWGLPFSRYSGGGNSYDDIPDYYTDFSSDYGFSPSESSSSDPVTEFYNNPYRTPGIKSRGEEILNGETSPSGSRDSAGDLPKLFSGKGSTQAEYKRVKAKLEEVRQAMAKDKLNVGKLDTAVLQGRKYKGDPDLIAAEEKYMEELRRLSAETRQEATEFNRRLAIDRAHAQDKLDKALYRDKIKADWFSDPPADGSFGSWLKRNIGNPAAELVGLRPSYEQAIHDAEAIQRLRDKVKKLNRVKEKETR